jgi:adenosylhomocysteinase
MAQIRTTPGADGVRRMTAYDASDVADPQLADDGRARIDWGARQMPALAAIRERFAAELPLQGVRVGACLHVTTETANLLRVLRAGGADVALCASNPLSTQDDVAAALADEGIAVFARSGVDRATYDGHVDAVLDTRPTVLLDDGCDLVEAVHTRRRGALDGVVGGCEDTPTGVVRLRAMAAEGVLRFPVVDVSDTDIRRMFDSRHGTGQSTIEAILWATNLLLAGRTVVVAGFGAAGRGVAERARGLGAEVVVTEVDPVRALDARMHGYRVLPMLEAAALADVLVTVTGNRSVVRREHLEALKDGAVLANAGHFDVEIDLGALAELAVSRVRSVRPHTDEYAFADGRRVLLLAEGRVVNLAAAEGSPPTAMDLAFATQALTVEWLTGAAPTLAPAVHAVPAHLDRQAATVELAAMGVTIDEMTDEQRRYLSAWGARA